MLITGRFVDVQLHQISYNIFVVVVKKLRSLSGGMGIFID